MARSQREGRVTVMAVVETTTDRVGITPTRRTIKCEAIHRRIDGMNCESEGTANLGAQEHTGKK